MVASEPMMPMTVEHTMVTAMNPISTATAAVSQIRQSKLFADQRTEWENHQAGRADADYVTDQTDDGGFLQNDGIDTVARGAHDAQGREFAFAFVHRRGEYGEQHNHAHYPDHRHENLEEVIQARSAKFWCWR